MFLFFRSNKSLNLISDQQLDFEGNSAANVSENTTNTVFDEDNIKPNHEKKIHKLEKSRSHHSSSSSGSQKSRSKEIRSR